MPTATPKLLEVRDLTVHYDAGEDDGDDAPVVAVDNLSLDVRSAEVVGILGESGCGKSSLALALLGLLAPGGTIVGGSVRFQGQELMGLAESELRRLRGAEISLIFQEPALALHPTRRVGEQIVEVIRAHDPSRERGRRRRHRETARELLLEVGFRPEDAIYHAFPHELSGGQRQRIVIAQALACRPELVIADEPTASLDSATQGQILDLLGKLRERLGVAFLLISHDPLVLEALADRVLVMYAGRRVEEGPRDQILAAPLHPYTAGLLACGPPAERPPGGPRPLPTLPGRAPTVRGLGPGCRFAPRCTYRMERCEAEDPKDEQTGAGTPGDSVHKVCCFKYSPSSDETRVFR